MSNPIEPNLTRADRQVLKSLLNDIELDRTEKDGQQCMCRWLFATSTLLENTCVQR